MLERIGSVDNVPQAVEAAKTQGVRLMGFGHRVYKNYDPRAKIVKELADQVFEVVPRTPVAGHSA